MLHDPKRQDSVQSKKKNLKELGKEETSGSSKDSAAEARSTRRRDSAGSGSGLGGGGDNGNTSTIGLGATCGSRGLLGLAGGGSSGGEGGLGLDALGLVRLALSGGGSSSSRGVSLGLGLSGGRGGGGGRGSALGLLVVGAVALLHNDGLPAARVVAVDVLGDIRVVTSRVVASIVDNGDTLVVSVEGSLGEVGVTTSPLNGTFGAVLSTGNPCTELDLHRSLGEGLTTLGIGSLESSDNLVVDEPVNIGGSPLDGVLVVRAERVVDGVVSTTVVGSSIALAEVVGLNLGVIATNPFPIDLYKWSAIDKYHYLVHLPHQDRRTGGQRW